MRLKVNQVGLLCNSSVFFLQFNLVLSAIQVFFLQFNLILFANQVEFLSKSG